MRQTWLLAILMLVLALVVAGCGPTAAPDEGPDVGAPTTLPDTGGEGATPEVSVETATVELGTAAPTLEAEMTTATPEAVDATGTPEVTGSTETAEPGSLAGINEVTFVGTEYAFQGPESIPAGWTRLTLDNQGARVHDLQPVWLEEGRTLDDIMTALQGDGPPDWVRLYGGVTAQPGESESFLVNLDPGNYVLLSFGDSEEGLPDAAQGMISELTVTEADTAGDKVELPEADVHVDLVDFDFAVDGEIQPGEHLLRVSNSGEEMHELIIFRLKEGKTLEDVQTLLDQEASGDSAANPDEVGDFAGGTQLSPGVEIFVTQEFEPGTYVFICFIPSPANNMAPHFELGMMEEVVVE